MKATLVVPAIKPNYERLWLHSSDDAVTLRTPDWAVHVNGTGVEGGAVTVDMREFMTAVRNFRGPVTMTAVDNLLVLRNGDASVKIAAEMISNPDPDHDDTLGHVRVKGLRRAIAAIVPCISNDRSRVPLLRCLCVEAKTERLRLTTTDGYRMARAELPCEPDLVRGETLLVHDGVDVLRKLCRDDESSVSWHRDGVSFGISGVTVRVRVVDETPPSYDSVIASALAGVSCTSLISTKEWLQALGVVGSEPSRPKGGVFTFHGDTVKIRAGTASVTVKAEIEGKPPEEVALNLKYLAEAIVAVRPCTRARLCLAMNSLNPCLVRPANDDSVTTVIMPMRV